jgi:cytoskeletal protein CcmA (bactofilin family)
MGGVRQDGTLKQGAEQAMALFSKDSENNPKLGLRPAMPATPAATPAAPAQAPAPEPTALRTPSPTPAATAASTGEARAYLDKGSKISGKLFFEGPVRIDGQVDGEISANDAVLIGEGAVVTAQLKAASVVIAGKISGDILAGKRIEIRPTAKVFGNLTTPVLVVHDGALFEGHCTMHPEAKEDRKVTPIVAKEERVVPQIAAGGNKLG